MIEEKLPKGCKYFYSAYLKEGILVNSGYNCSHEKQLEVLEIEGKKIGCCYPWSCPLTEGVKAVC